MNRSRKLNTLLENAIQEAMAELDKKSERVEPAPEGTSANVIDGAPITETPKRTKKVDKVKGKDKMPKKNPVKIAPNPHKTGDGARLRSSRWQEPTEGRSELRLLPFMMNGNIQLGVINTPYAFFLC